MNITLTLQRGTILMNALTAEAKANPPLVSSGYSKINLIGEEKVTISGDKIGPVTQRLYDELTGIQWGTLPDDMGWTQEVE